MRITRLHGQVTLETDTGALSLQFNGARPPQELAALPVYISECLTGTLYKVLAPECGHAEEINALRAKVVELETTIERARARKRAKEEGV